MAIIFTRCTSEKRSIPCIRPSSTTGKHPTQVVSNKKVGLYINPTKTKSMRINANSSNKIKVRGAEIEKYGTIIFLLGLYFN